MENKSNRRILKIVVAFAVIAAMCVSSFFTMKYVGDNAEMPGGDMMQQGMQGGEPPEKPEASSAERDGQGESKEPDMKSNDKAGEDPQGNNGSGGGNDTDVKTMSQDVGDNDGRLSGEPPEKPSGSSLMNDPPAKPSGESGETVSADKKSGESEEDNADADTEDAEQGGDISQGQPGAAPEAGMPVIGQRISYKYYAVFGAEALVAALAVMYLIMTGSGRRNLREVFKNHDKIVIFILAAALLTSGFTFAEGKMTEYLFMNDGKSDMMAGQSAADISYSAVKEITSDENVDSGTFVSEEKDENAVLAGGDIEAVLSGITVTKTGDSDGGDNSSFYGINSGITAKDGAVISVKNAKITTDASGANGVFCFGGSATTDNSSGDGTTVSLENSEITTSGDNSGGIMTTGGGKTEAKDLVIETSGISSAAIRSDRGGGSVSVKGGTYTTTGKGSPSIYSTADIDVEDARLISKASEGVVIEGKNSVSLKDCKLIDSNTQLNGQSTTYKNIFLYQSMSGDAAEGTADFTAENCSITTKKGDTLYVTNTTASISLENNKIINKDSNGNFLRIQKDSWGNEGTNGGDVTLKLTDQKVSGNIVVDSISSLDMKISSGSVYEGTINGDNTAKSLKLTIDGSSKIKLTGDSYVTAIDTADGDYSNIDFNGYKLYVDGKAVANSLK